LRQVFGLLQPEVARDRAQRLASSVVMPFTPLRFWAETRPNYQRPMATPETPEEWMAFAAEARAIACTLQNPTAKRTMMSIAAAYGNMAWHAALVAAKQPVVDEQTRRG
jgi:hypothetical protein